MNKLNGKSTPPPAFSPEPGKPVRILSLGKYRVHAEPDKPYFAGLDLKGDGVAVLQPMTERDFFMLVNSLLKPTKQSCGEVHVPTVTLA